jgi:hypothetical protein
MATKSNLMGLGLPAPLANRMGDCLEAGTSITAQGATQASAYQIGGSQYVVNVTASSSGCCVSLPAIGGDNGALIGDDFVITLNMSGGSCTVFAPGASTVINQGGAQISASTGVSVSAYKVGTYVAVTPSVWAGMMG